MKIPRDGYCIATRSGNYEACFTSAGKAVRAAKRLAKRKARAVDVVKVSDGDRSTYREISPRSR